MTDWRQLAIRMAEVMRHTPGFFGKHPEKDADWLRAYNVVMGEYEKAMSSDNESESGEGQR